MQMTNCKEKRRIEFGDFQTPRKFALQVCERLAVLGVQPDVVIEPTCGTGSFVLAAAQVFSSMCEIYGYDINRSYIQSIQKELKDSTYSNRVKLKIADFFDNDWNEILHGVNGTVLVLGNLPWVTNAAQGVIGGRNLPEKSNFLKYRGCDAITGKANFDISEWMLLEVLRWFQKRSGDIAMLVKTSVARKVLAYVERHKLNLREAFLIRIDALENFGASVDACCLVIRLSGDSCNSNYDYKVFDALEDKTGSKIGHRMGLTIADLNKFENVSFLLGQSPQKWRSGIKHDAAAVMEFSKSDDGLKNGFGEIVKLEPTYIYPLMKGSDVAKDHGHQREKFVLVTQTKVGEATQQIEECAPLTWAYLQRYAEVLDARASSIYAKNPRFAIFGIGEYAYRPWRIAICGLYKDLRFRLVGPKTDRPVMFDDTVYYLSFDTEGEALEVLRKLNSKSAIELLTSLIFWDEKRPIKASILNALDWSLVQEDYQADIGQSEAVADNLRQSAAYSSSACT